MKAELNKDGYIVITAETVVEGFAIESIMPKDDGHSCGACGRQNIPVMFDCGILLEKEVPCL